MNSRRLAHGVTALVVALGATVASSSPASAAEVLAGTQFGPDGKYCTFGPVYRGISFAAAHCASEGWEENEEWDVRWQDTTSSDAVRAPGRVLDVAGYVDPEPGMWVFKSGVTTGVTGGVIAQVQDGWWVAEGLQLCSGDSGSPVFTYVDHQVYLVGMGVGGDGSLDADGVAHHDKRCYRTDRSPADYLADGPTMTKMLSLAGVAD